MLLNKCSSAPAADNCFVVSCRCCFRAFFSACSNSFRLKKMPFRFTVMQTDHLLNVLSVSSSLLFFRRSLFCFPIYLVHFLCLSPLDFGKNCYCSLVRADTLMKQTVGCCCRCCCCFASARH